MTKHTVNDHAGSPHGVEDAFPMVTVSDRLTAWLTFFGVRVGESRDAYLISWQKPNWRLARRTFLGTILLLYGVLFVASLPRFSFWGPFATIDEQLQYYLVARNYAEYGFLTNYLLPDLSSASSPAHHPYLYNHQPPGPQLLIGLLIRVFGERYTLIRIILAIIFLLGLCCFARVLAHVPLGGHYFPELALLFIRPNTIMHSIDHPAYAAFPFCAFFPIVALERYHASGRTGWLVAAAGVTFLAANYLIYGPLIMIFVMWTLGAALNVMPLKRSELLLLYAVALLGFALHLSQTVLAVGWAVFIDEFLFTLSNRMTGIPTRSELLEFFQSHGLVLYGDHALQASRLGAAVWEVLSFPGRQGWAAVLAVIGCLGLVTQTRVDEREVLLARPFAEWLWAIVRATLWIGLSVVTPVLMFPAFSSGYLLGGTNEFLLALFCVLSLTATLKFVRRMAVGSTLRDLARVLCVVGLAWIGLAQVKAAGRVVSEVGEWIVRSRPEADVFRVRDELRGKAAMTNVDPAVVGFFTREAAFGGCHRASVLGPGIDVAKCFVHFVRGYPSSGGTQPSVYVWFRDGNPFCADAAECIEREDLEGMYERLFGNKLIAAFNLQKRLTEPKREASTAPSP